MVVCVFWPCDQRHRLYLYLKCPDKASRRITGSHIHEQGRPLLTVLHSLFSGFLSGLVRQSEITELLDEIYYEALK